MEETPFISQIHEIPN